MPHPIEKTLRWSFFLFLLNLLLGLLFCFVISPVLVGKGVTQIDPDGYGAEGQRLYETRQYPTIDKPPLYPAWIALVSSLVGGYRVKVIQLSQVILSAISCVIFYAIFRKLIPSHARLAGFATAIYPMTIWYSSRLWTETFLTFLLAVMFYLFTHLVISNPGASPTKPHYQVTNSFLCGFACGFCALTKGAMLVFAGLLPLVLFCAGKARAAGKVAAFLAGFSLLVIPWTWRNFIVSGVLIPIQTRGGYNFYLGNSFARHWSEAPGSYSRLKELAQVDIDLVFARAGRQPVNALDADRLLMKADLQELSTDPGLFLWKLTANSLMFWYLAADPVKSLLTGLMQIPVVIAAIIGSIISLKRSPQALLLLIPVTGVMASSLPIFAFARLASVIMPYLLALATCTLSISLQENP